MGPIDNKVFFSVCLYSLSVHCVFHTGPSSRAFEWLDDKKGSSKKLSKTPAKLFIDTSLTQIQKQLEDETVFPTKFGQFCVCTSMFIIRLPRYAYPMLDIPPVL